MIAKAQTHPAQLLACLAAAEPTLTRALVGDPDSWLSSVWKREKRECHGLMDLAWFVPAFCLLQTEAEFTNKFGERVDADYLVRHLLEQSQRSLRAQACYGMHNLYALGLARECLSPQLDANTRQALNEAWERRVCALLGLIDDFGVLDVRPILGQQACSEGEFKQMYLHVTGHLIEAVAASRDPDLFADRRFHLLVRDVIERCQGPESCWSPDAPFAKGAGGVRTYVTMSHVVRGLVLYRKTVQQR